MRSTPDFIHKLLHVIAGTRPEEMNCDECWQHLDRFTELYLAGKNPAQALPLVEEHLQRCPGCREEFEALVQALKSSD